MGERQMTSIRRILVAMDPSPPGLAALEAAGSLAAEMQAELQGLFVEDVNLLRLAGLPFTREIACNSATQRRLSLSEMEQALHAKAEQVRRALATTARRVSVHWSFAVARGHVTRASLAAAHEADLLLIGRESSPLRWSEQSPVTPRPIVVVIDKSEASRRSLELACRLTRDDQAGIVIGVAAEDPAGSDELRRQVVSLLGEGDVPVDSELISAVDASELMHLARREHARLLLINRDSPLLGEETIESLVNDLDCPIGLVR